MPFPSTAMPSSYLDDTLRRKVLFLTGKGGVGKSTVAWATALACQQAGAKVRLASWAPFSETAPPDWLTRTVPWARLDTLGCFKEYVLKHFKVDALYSMIFENKIFRSFVLAAPGLAETVVAGKIWDLVESREQDLVIVDLPSSGHAISFFQSTLGIQKIFPVGFVHEQTSKILKMWQSSECRIDIVSLPEEMPVTESRELKTKLEEVIQSPLGYFILNRCLPEFDLSQPTQVAAELAQERSRYLERKAEEKRLVDETQKAELPLVRLTQFAEPSLQVLVEQIRKQIATAGATT